MAEEKENIVSLSGAPWHQPGKPNPAVIEELERALEMARSGEIEGVFAVYMHNDDCSSFSINGTKGRIMLGTVELAKSKLLERTE